MKIIITEDQYNLLFESKTDKFKKFLKDKFDFELEVKLIETYVDIPTKIRDLIPRWWFTSQVKPFGPLYLFKFKDRTFLFVDSEKNGGFALEIVYHNSLANGMEQKMEKLSYNKIGGTNSLTGNRLNDIFNISEIGLDPIDIIKLYL
jgi:hypothetical protein